ncbi:Protein of unknown function [Lentibacillus halodurans]|uniref:DUF3397 domain-containing protein n=1 Tax=Lentibacillus halodurans TaxID=237679 RepID=A0A1I0Z3G5_9BACI|nr:DUF3397 domain-containing protein [Lentibacillus halodurans]SFB18813.1 Protein of unknown function [Lentibacillus halodurans]
MIMNLFAYFAGTIITMPILATIVVYLAGVKVFRHKWKAVHTAVNWTTFLYIIAVGTMLKIMFGNSFSGIILAILLAMFAVIATVQWKMYTEVVFAKVFKVFWRVCFLLFLLLYCLLVLTGIVLH